MTLEVGKFYKTRSGDKVRIYATDGRNMEDAPHPVHGAILCENGWVAEQWSVEGKYDYDGSATQSDIVSEWTPYHYPEHKGENLADQ